MPFTCSICEEASTRICVACTKDSCENHLCEKCSRCSDCCGCEVSLNEREPALAGSVNGAAFLTDGSEFEAPAIAGEEGAGEARVQNFGELGEL